AAPPAVSCHCAPASTSDWAFSLVRLWTWSVWPALSKCPAMLRPMTPVPMKAIECDDMRRAERPNAAVAKRKSAAPRCHIIDDTTARALSESVTYYVTLSRTEFPPRRARPAGAESRAMLVVEVLAPVFLVIALGAVLQHTQFVSAGFLREANR